MNPLTTMLDALQQHNAGQLSQEQFEATLKRETLAIARTMQPLKIIQQDILCVTHGVICHQVNIQGAMGAGLALAIKRKWPIVFEKYKVMCDRQLFHLGSIQPVQVSETLWVCNLAGQEFYGKGLQTDYEAVRMGLEKINKWAGDRNFQVYLPYKMGAGLAGGDWAVIEQIIKETAPSAVICQKESDRPSP